MLWCAHYAGNVFYIYWIASTNLRRIATCPVKDASTLPPKTKIFSGVTRHWRSWRSNSKLLLIVPRFWIWFPISGPIFCWGPQKGPTGPRSGVGPLFLVPKCSLGFLFSGFIFTFWNCHLSRNGAHVRSAKVWDKLLLLIFRDSLLTTFLK